MSFNKKKFIEESISYLSIKGQNIIEKKRKIFEKYCNGNEYLKKNYYIIQSNTTNINENLIQFPNNKIIIQINPLNSGILKKIIVKGLNLK